METIFNLKQIVWAKVKGYPWWPAQISKTATSDANFYKVTFIAEDNQYIQIQTVPFSIRKMSKNISNSTMNSKKNKMKGLTQAIEAADQLYQKRERQINKTIQPNCPSQNLTKKYKPAKKLIKHKSTKSINSKSQLNDQQQKQDQFQQNNEIVIIGLLKSDTQQLQQKDASLDQPSLDHIIMEGQEKVDRTKIQNIEETLMKIIEEIRQNSFQPSIYSTLQSIVDTDLFGEEVTQSKVTRMVKFIILKIQQRNDLNSNHKILLQKLKFYKSNMEQKVIDYLTDTSYYDNYLKLIRKNKKTKQELEKKLYFYLKNTHKIKKEISQLLAARLISQINQGNISNQKQLVDDIKVNLQQFSCTEQIQETLTIASPSTDSCKTCYQNIDDILQQYIMQSQKQSIQKYFTYNDLKIQISQQYYSAKLLKQYPNKIFVFGDNIQRYGTGGQAAIRNQCNSHGIVTKKKPKNDKSAFMTDNQYLKNKEIIQKGIVLLIQKAKKHKKIIVFPAKGLGTGRAALQQKARQTYLFLNKLLYDNFSIINGSQAFHFQKTKVQNKKQQIISLD